MEANEHFLCDPGITAAVERLMDLASRMERGSLVTKETIIETAAIPNWNSAWQRFRRDLLLSPSGIAFRYLHDLKAYEMMMPDEQVKGVPKRRFRKMQSQGRKIIKEVGAVPDDDLSDHDRRHKILAHEQASTLIKGAKQAEREQKIFDRKEATPIPPSSEMKPAVDTSGVLGRKRESIARPSNPRN